MAKVLLVGWSGLCRHPCLPVARTPRERGSLLTLVKRGQVLLHSPHQLLEVPRRVHEASWNSSRVAGCQGSRASPDKLPVEIMQGRRQQLDPSLGLVTRMNESMAAWPHRRSTCLRLRSSWPCRMAATAAVISKLRVYSRLQCCWDRWERRRRCHPGSWCLRECWQHRCTSRCQIRSRCPRSAAGCLTCAFTGPVHEADRLPNKSSVLKPGRGDAHHHKPKPNDAAPWGFGLSASSCVSSDGGRGVA